MSYHDDFWKTIEFLEFFGSTADMQLFGENFGEWLNNISYKLKMHMAQIKMLKVMHRHNGIEEDFLDFGNFLTCSVNYPPVRSSLEMLTGNSIGRLTDKKMMVKLMSKIKENHEKQQVVRIEERKKQELLRTKNMILRGFIPVQEAPKEIRQYPLFQLYLYCDNVIENKRKMRASKKVKMSNSLYKLLYPNQEEDNIETNEEVEIYMKKIYVGSTEEMIPLSPEEVAKYLEEQEAKKEIDDGYMVSKEDYDRLHYETDAIKNLRGAQTVEDLYTKAYEIIGTLYSHMNKEVGKEEKSQINENTDKTTADIKTEEAKVKETTDIT